MAQLRFVAARTFADSQMMLRHSALELDESVAVSAAGNQRILRHFDLEELDESVAALASSSAD